MAISTTVTLSDPFALTNVSFWILPLGLTCFANADSPSVYLDAASRQHHIVYLKYHGCSLKLLYPDI